MSIGSNIHSLLKHDEEHNNILELSANLFSVAIRIQMRKGKNTSKPYKREGLRKSEEKFSLPSLPKQIQSDFSITTKRPQQSGVGRRKDAGKTEHGSI